MRWTEEDLLKLGRVLPESYAASIEGRRGPPDPDYRDIWSSLSPGERTYICVFLGAIKYRLLPNILVLCRGDMIKARALHLRLTRDRDASRLDVTGVTLAQQLRDMRARDKKNEDPQTRRSSGWTREDVVAEYYDETGEPRLGPPRKKSEPIMPEYDQAPSPVRKVSVEEYQRTKRNPVYGGVKPEFAKESEHFAKELPDSADKIYDGTPLDELIGQTT